MEEQKRLIIGSDPSAFSLKEAIKAHLQKEGFAITDVGTTSDTPVMFYDAAKAVGSAISCGEYTRGIVFCGSGMGVTLIANKFPGVYCAPCENVLCAKNARVINNANVLALGGNITPPELGIEITETFLNTPWLFGVDAETEKILRDGYALMESFR